MGGNIGNTGFTTTNTAAFPLTKNVTSIETFNTTPIISPPKEYYEPTIETHRNLVGAQNISTFPPIPLRPSTPPNAGFGFNSGGGGMCDKCCSCFGRSGSYGVGMNPQMNMGMGMSSGGCCSRMFGGMCGGFGGGCCPNRGMGMGQSTGCFGNRCCPFGGQRNIGMGM